MNLTPEEEQSFQEFVNRFREDALPKIADSALTLSLVPGGTEPGRNFDVKFAVELGASIMLDKPIVALCTPCRGCPPGLRRVAHTVIELTEDVDTEAGRRELEEKLRPVIESLVGRQSTESQDDTRE